MLWILFVVVIIVGVVVVVAVLWPWLLIDDV